MPTERLTQAETEQIVRDLKTYPEEVIGQGTEGLVGLIQRATARFRVATAPFPESLKDFVPEESQPAFVEAEAAAYEALKALAKAARKACESLPPPEGSTAFVDACEEQPWLKELSHFEAAAMRLLGPSADNHGEGRLESIVAAVRTLAAFPLPPAETRGVRPISNCARIAVRASYYYRHRENLSLTVNWDYRDREGRSVGKRSEMEDLLPATPAAKLACAVVKAFGFSADHAEVKNHLQNYRAQLKADARDPRLEDFMERWV